MRLTPLVALTASACVPRDRSIATPNAEAGPEVRLKIEPACDLVPLVALRAVVAEGDEVRSLIWDLGDGTSAFGDLLLHTFPTAGTYPVTLVAEDTSGRQSRVQQDLTVSTCLSVSEREVNERPEGALEGLAVVNFPLPDAADGSALPPPVSVRFLQDLLDASGQLLAADLPAGQARLEPGTTVVSRQETPWPCPGDCPPGATLRLHLVEPYWWPQEDTGDTGG